MDLVAFFEEKANETTTRRQSSGDNKPSTFLGKLILSEENENYVFSVIDIGVQIKSHDQKFPARPKLCMKYYGEDCEECNKPSGFKNKRKVKDEATGEEVEIEVEGKKAPKRKLHAICYLHNYTGATKTKKDSDETYQPNPVFVSDWACGEANTQTKLEKDRNIKNIMSVKDLDCLESTVFYTKRVPAVNEKTNKKYSATQYPQPLPEKASIEYTIPGVGKVKNPVKNLTVPDDIIKKFENMTVQEKYGLILATQFDQESIRRDFWQEKGVVFPPEPAKKDEEKTTTSLQDE